VSRYTIAYSEFVKRTSEVSLLASRASQIERSRLAYQGGEEINALCRGAMVLLSSHIEAYVKEVGEVALDAIYSKKVCRSRIKSQFFYYASKARLKRIKDSSLPDSVSK
jgi:hypothetical protein